MQYLEILFWISAGAIIGYVGGTILTAWAFREEIGYLESKEDDREK